MHPCQNGMKHCSGSRWLVGGHITRDKPENKEDAPVCAHRPGETFLFVLFGFHSEVKASGILMTRAIKMYPRIQWPQEGSQKLVSRVDFSSAGTSEEHMQERYWKINQIFLNKPLW